MELTEKDIERFWKYVEVGKEFECWRWVGDKSTKGYGIFMVFPGRKKLGAHRVSYEINHGEIGGGLEVRHICNNPICVNPEHLLLGTHKDNMQDMTKSYRAVNQRGAQTSQEKEQEIVSLAKLGLPYREISEIVGIPLGTCRDVAARNNIIRHKSHTPVSNFEREKIHSLYKEGKSIREIGRIISRGHKLIIDVLKRSGTR